MLKRKIIITGDLNFHLDDNKSSDTKKFLNYLKLFNLAQHIQSPTHRKSHTPDVLIPWHDSQLISNESKIEDTSIMDSLYEYSLDHFAVIVDIKTTTEKAAKKIVSYRDIKNINLENMNILIRKVLTLTDFSHTDIECQIQHYNTKLKNVHNEIAPVTTKTRTVRPHTAVWYNKDIKASKQLCKKYEIKWRKSGLTVNKQIYKNLCCKFNKLLKLAKSAYIQSIINDNTSNRKRLFQTLKTLNQFLEPSSSTILPSCINTTKNMCGNFAQHFLNKVEKRFKSFKMSNTKFMVNHEGRSMVENENFDGELFLSFSCVSQTQVPDLLTFSTSTTCSLSHSYASAQKIQIYYLGSHYCYN